MTPLSSCTKQLAAVRQHLQANKHSCLTSARSEVRRIRQRRARHQAQIRALKQSDLYAVVQDVIGPRRHFQTQDLDQLTQQLNLRYPLGGWRWELVSGAVNVGVVVYSQHEGLCPGLVFCAQDNGFRLCSFHFDLHSKVEQQGALL